MQAIIKIAHAENISNQALNARDKQALIHQYTVLGIVDNEIRSLAEARVYMSASRSAERMTAILWVHGANYASGSGYAGGLGFLSCSDYRYHKPSAAVSKAIDAAGFGLEYDIFGGGEEQLCNALKAVALAAWPDVDESTLYVCEAHN